MTVSYTSNRVTVGNFKNGITGTSGSNNIVDAGAGFQSSDVGRFIMIYPAIIDAGSVQVRLITAFVSASEVTVQDSWIGGAPAAGVVWRMSHNLEDIHALNDPALTKGGNNSYQWDADWSIQADGFLADKDVSLDMTSQGYSIGWRCLPGSCVQFGVLWGGEKNNSTETTNGCHLRFKTLQPTHSLISGGASLDADGAVVNYYGCSVDSEAVAGSWMFQRMSGPMRFIGCNFDGPMGGRFLNGNTEWAECRHSGNNLQTPAWSLGVTFIRPIKNIKFFQNNTCVKSFAAYIAEFRNTEFAPSNTNIFLMSGNASSITDMIDCTTLTSAGIIDGGSGTVNQYKSVNYTLTDPALSPIQDVKVAIADTNDVLQGTISVSDSSGVYPEILALFSQFVDNPTEIILHPFTISIRKYGVVYQSISSPISDPIKQGVVLESNNHTVLSETAAFAQTGIGVVPDNITLTENHTVSELYDYIQAWSVDDANILQVEALTTTDGANYSLATGWDLVFDGGVITDNLSISGNIVINVANQDLSNVAATKIIIQNPGAYSFTDVNVTEIENTSLGVVDIVSNTAIATITDTGAGSVTNVLDITVNVTTPLGFDDSIAVYATRAGAETEDAGQQLATGTTFNASVANNGGSTVYYRMEQSSGDFIIDSYVIPASAGVYDVALVVTAENAAIAQILSIAQSTQPIITDSNKLNKVIMGLVS